MTKEKKKTTLTVKKKMDSNSLVSYLELENKKDELRLLMEENKEKRELIEKRMNFRSKKINDLKRTVYYPEMSNR
ncbi:MAG: hypothetical protein IKG39_10720 [Lachnospiraceae bacterium]|nr:hypothetical protein [Lachnospiraceae bacterium]